MGQLNEVTERHRFDVDRLHESHAAGGDELNLYAKLLDGVDDRRHHVTAELVKEEKRNDPRWCLGSPWREDKLDPVEHNLLVEPRFLVDAVCVLTWSPAR